MPLLDHFHKPWCDEAPWESMTLMWAAKLTGWLNRTLPAGEYRAFANIHLGPRVAADVAEVGRERSAEANGRHAATATVTDAPPAVATIPAIFTDEAEVQVSTTYRTFRLLGVIELVSLANKKGAGERQAFVSKCEAYLRQGVGLVVVDVVTERLANLHNELMARLGGDAVALLPHKRPTYVSGYRPVRRDQQAEIDVWPYPAAVGQPLPSPPLCLRGGPVVTLDLEGTYQDALSDMGIS